MNQITITNRIRNSFPKELSQEVNVIAELLSVENIKCNRLYSNNNIEILLNGSIINIPYRIYFSELKNTAKLNENERNILNCIYSRHNNGFVRQKYIEKMIENKNYWVTPFFIQLFGEYIYRIIEIFNEYLTNNLDNCIKFINENQKYWKKIESKVASYWNEYYREECPKYSKYLGKEIINKIRKNSIRSHSI